MVSRSQVRRAGERLRRDETPSDADRQIYSDYRKTFEEPLREVGGTIRNFAGDAPIQSRLKRFETVVEKLQRGTSDLSRLEDIAGCRVVLPTMIEQQQVLDRIRKTWQVIRERDYQASPRDGYRALHVVVRVRERPVEVQIRTAWEDMWANASEELAKRVDPAIKNGGGPPAVREVLEDLSLLCAGLDAAFANRDTRAPGDSLKELLTAAGVAILLRALASIPSDTLPGEFEVAFSDAQNQIVREAIESVMRVLQSRETTQ